jgi:hypothetical protein
MCPKGVDHEWEAPVQSRTRLGWGCPYCGGHKRLCSTNSFAAKHPRLAALWHTRLNGKLTPDKVLSSSTTAGLVALRAWPRMAISPAQPRL